MYTMYMALHINNPLVEQKVRDLASVTGGTITDAIGMAVDAQLALTGSRLKAGPPATADEILSLVRSFHLEPINEDLTEDEILGYGPEGYCE